MKKLFLAVLSVLLLFVFSFGAVSVSPQSIPEILTVAVGEPSDYGYIDYSFFDADGNDISFSGNDSYLPQSDSHSVLFSQSVSSVPEKYDSRDAGAVTSTKQQGLSGNCWAFATMSMLESDAVVQGLDDIEAADYSEAHFSWFTARSLTENTDDPAYGDGVSYDEPFMTGGNWVISAGSLARWVGAAEESDYPFSPDDLSAMGNYDESERYDRGSGIIINSAEELTDMADAKEWIMDHGSATLAFYFDLSYYNSTSCAYYYNGTETLNHQITVIGWDDDYSSENFNSDCRPSGNGAWLCKNSWGDWGNDGCFWISYYDSSIDQFAGVSARSVDDFYRNYTYNGAGWESYFSHSGTAALANVFTAKGSELLTGVSTYTMSSQQEINLRIYKDLPSAYTNPESGELVYEYSTVIDRAGYHTIDLESRIPLEEGTVFSVVFEFVTDDVVYIPVEADGRGTNSYYSESGQSYAYLPQYNSGWYDNVLYGFENAFIQAFSECNHTVVTDCVEPTCTESGYIITLCSVCGKTVSEEELSATGHSFSAWSGYVHDFESGKEVSTRECLSCGYTEVNTIFYVKNTVRIDELTDMFFEKILDFIRQLFAVRKG